MPAEARAALVKRLRTEMEAAGAPPSTATLGALVAVRLLWLPLAAAPALILRSSPYSLFERD